MAITIHHLEDLLKASDLKYERQDDEFLVSCRTEHYQNKDGRSSLLLVAALKEQGEYFVVFAPMAFKIEGSHRDAFLRACAMIQWRVKLISFEFDAKDGEVRPTVKIPIEDGTLTAKQVERCVRGLWQLVDKFAPILERVRREGVIEFPDEKAPDEKSPGEPDHAEQIVEFLAGRVPKELLKRALLLACTKADCEPRVPIFSAA